MGVKMGQKRVFRNFLKNWQTDLVPSPSKGRYHHSSYLCLVSSPDHFLFSRYRVKWWSKWVKNWVFVIFSKTSKPIWFHFVEKGVKTGSKIDLFDNISKSLHLFLEFFYMSIQVYTGHFLVKTTYLGKVLLRTYRFEKCVKSTRNGTCGYISKQDGYMIISG